MASSESTVFEVRNRFERSVIHFSPSENDHHHFLRATTTICELAGVSTALNLLQ
jgi:hypothetical protein